MQRDSRRRKSSVAADDARIAHHTFDLFVEFVAVGDDQDAGLGIVFEQPLGDEHHEDAFAAALGVPDAAAFALGDAVEVNHHVRTAFVTTAQGHLLGDRKIIPFRMVPVHQVHCREGLIAGGLHRHAVTEKLIRAQIGLVKGDARGVGGGFQFSQRGGNLGAGVAARLEIRGEQVRFDAAVVLPFAPVPGVAIAKVVATRGVGEESDDAVLRAAFGAGGLAHRLISQWPLLREPARRSWPRVCNRWRARFTALSDLPSGAAISGTVRSGLFFKRSRMRSGVFPSVSAAALTGFFKDSR